MTSKKLHDAAIRAAEELGATLLPYPTAEKIIAEVMKNGPKAREKVMHMLLEYLTESLKAREKMLKDLKEALGILCTNPRLMFLQGSDARTIQA